NLKLAKLSWDIAQLLKVLDGRDAAAAAATASKKTTVYLAQCSHDRRNARDAVEADLKLNGYPVLPDRMLPMEAAAYKTAVGQMLAVSKLSVHLIGSGYGVVPDGSGEKSVVVLQNELAAAASTSAGLRRIIWCPEGTTPGNEPQRAFIDALHGDAAL